MTRDAASSMMIKHPPGTNFHSDLVITIGVGGAVDAGIVIDRVIYIHPGACDGLSFCICYFTLCILLVIAVFVAGTRFGVILFA